MKSNKFKKYFDYTFLTVGSMVLIVLGLIVAMNFSKDARLFAKTSVEDTKNKPTKLSDSNDEAQTDEYGTIKFEKSQYSDGTGEKKAYKIKVEVINQSGRIGLEKDIKSTLESSGFEVTVKQAETKTKNEGNQTQEHKGEDKAVVSTPQNENKQGNTTKPSNDGKTVEGGKTESDETTSNDPKNGDTKTSSDEKIGDKENTGNDESTNNKETASGVENTPQPRLKATATPQKIPDTSTGTVGQTQIIERNDKQLGQEVKKVIKVGKIIKQVDSKSGVDVTIILGSDYNP